MLYIITSIRILTSLETFLDNLDLNTVNQTSGSNSTALTFETFALQIEDVNINTFNGQTFTVALGPVEQARNVSSAIDQRALITEDSEGDSTRNKGASIRNSTEATAALQVQPMFFRDCISSETNTSSPAALRQRLSYSVFLTDALFLPANRSLNKVGSIVVAARTSCLLENETILSIPIQSSFQILETVRLIFC